MNVKGYIGYLLSIINKIVIYLYKFLDIIIINNIHIKYIFEYNIIVTLKKKNQIKSIQYLL